MPHPNEAVAWALEALRAFPETLRTLVARVPEAALDWRPRSWDGIPSEELTVRQQLCHLRDIEIDGYLVRFRRVRDEPNPTLDSIDTYALIAANAYDRTPVQEAIAAFSDARQETLALLKGLSSGHLARRATFEGYGEVTLQGLIHYLCSHDQQHVAGIQWLLGQHAAAR